jgi:hypothetical protein
MAGDRSSEAGPYWAVELILNDLESVTWVEQPEPIFSIAFLFLGFDANKEADEGSKRSIVSWTKLDWDSYLKENWDR